MPTMPTLPTLIDTSHRVLSATVPPRRGDSCGGRRHARRRRQAAHRPPATRFDDRRGNLAVPYSYSSDSHRLLAVGASGRGYDANGNTTRRNLTTRSDATLGYDERNRLVSVASSGGTVSYRHNARGERVYKQVFGKTSRYAYDEAGRLLVEDASAAGGQVQEFLWLDDLPVGLLIGTTLYPIQPDHLGSPRKVTNQKLTAPILFWHWPILDNPFGEAQANQDPDGDRKVFPFHLRFPGQQYDPETGLHYNYFRDYEPGVGRYVESDPVGLRGGISTFSYVGSRPTEWMDRLGLLADGSMTERCYGQPDWVCENLRHPPLPDLKPCKYYDDVCRSTGCFYYCKTAPTICRYADYIPVPSYAFQGTEKLNCIRRCLVQEDGKRQAARACPGCLSDSQIDGYHVTCFVECGVPTWIYPGVNPPWFPNVNPQK